MSSPGWPLCHFKVTRWHRALGGAGGINLPGPLLSAGYLVKCFLNERLMEEEGWLQRTEPQGYPCRRTGCQLPAPAISPGEGGCDNPPGRFWELPPSVAVAIPALGWIFVMKEMLGKAPGSWCRWEGKGEWERL